LKNVLITGSNGYLGKRVASTIELSQLNIYHLSRSSADNKDIIQCDLTNKNDVKNLFNQIPFDIVIHCAGVVPKSSFHHHEEEYSKNNIMMDNILSFYSSNIIYCSSMTVYGADITGVIHEDEGFMPSNNYAKSKLQDEVLLTEASNPYYILRLPGLFGGGRKSGIIYNVIVKLLQDTLPNIEDKQKSWSSMHVDDAAYVISQLTNKDITNKILNIGYGMPQSIFRLIDILKNIMNKNNVDDINVDDNWVCLDVSKQKEIIGELMFSWELRLSEEVKIITNG